MINNRIVRNRSENSLGISVWSLGESKANRLLPDYFNVFDGNVFEDQGGRTDITAGYAVLSVLEGGTPDARSPLSPGLPRRASARAVS